MRQRLRKLLTRFLADETAPSAIEYAMLVAGVGVVLIALVYMLGGGARFDQAAPLAPAGISIPASP